MLDTKMKFGDEEGLSCSIETRPCDQIKLDIKRHVTGSVDNFINCKIHVIYDNTL